MKKILSIDGGGIRGIVPAVLLAEIEKRTGKRIADMFDMIGGTSTGGILTLGLTKPDKNNSKRPQYTAEQLISLYEKEGNKIFSRSRWYNLRSLGNLLSPKYTAHGIEAILEKYFGEARLSEALGDVIITSYDIERRQSYFFKSHKAKMDSSKDFLMRRVARSTSAAPTYFPPSRVEMEDDYLALVDGGVFANNPAMCAYVEARSIYPQQDDFLVVSVGTGENTKRLPYEQVTQWGLLNWAQPVLEVVFDGINDTIDYQLQQIVRPAADGSKRYYRFQIKLPKDVNEELDDCTPNNIRGLRLLGEELVRDYNEDIATVCNLITK